jgi:hypothetical protein
MTDAITTSGEPVRATTEALETYPRVYTCVRVLNTRTFNCRPVRSPHYDPALIVRPIKGIR